MKRLIEMLTALQESDWDAKNQQTKVWHIWLTQLTVTVSDPSWWWWWWQWWMPGCSEECVYNRCTGSRRLWIQRQTMGIPGKNQESSFMGGNCKFLKQKERAEEERWQLQHLHHRATASGTSFLKCNGIIRNQESPVSAAAKSTGRNLPMKENKCVDWQPRVWAAVS